MIKKNEVKKMSCEECNSIKEYAFNKNVPTSPPIAYVRIEKANVAIVGCKKHLKILLDRINKE